MEPRIKIRKSLLNKIWKAINPNFQDFTREYRCIFYDRDTFQQWDETHHAKNIVDLMLKLRECKRLKHTTNIYELPYVGQYEFRKYYDLLTA